MDGKRGLTIAVHAAMTTHNAVCAVRIDQAVGTTVVRASSIRLAETLALTIDQKLLID